MEGNADLDAFVQKFMLAESKDGITWTTFKSDLGVDKVGVVEMFLTTTPLPTDDNNDKNDDYSSGSNNNKLSTGNNGSNNCHAEQQ